MSRIFADRFSPCLLAPPTLEERLTRFPALSLILVAACAEGGASRAKADSATPPDSAVRPVPAARTSALPDSAEADAILRFLKRLAPPLSGAFNDSLVPPVPIDSVLALVSDSGLVSNDVNEGTDSVVVFSRAELRDQLASRHGRAFSQLGHLAYIASQPYPQYSRLAFTRTGNELRVEVGGWYVLGYVAEHGQTRLRRVSYEQGEGE